MAESKKVVLVLGATGDVGRGVVEAMLDSGWDVVACARDMGRLEALARGCSAGTPRLMSGDVSDEEKAASLACRIAGEVSVLDAVVASIGGARREVFLSEFTKQDLLQSISANLVPHLVALNTFVPAIGKGGTYLSMGGGLADFPMPRRGDVSLCQAAQRMMLRVLADEWRVADVRIRELIIHSKVNGESTRDVANVKWLTDTEIGTHVAAMLNHPEKYSSVIQNLKSRAQVGQPEKTRE